MLGNCSGTFTLFDLMESLFHGDGCRGFLTKTQLFITIFQCSPIDGFWDDLLRCEGLDAPDSLLTYMGCTIPHIITDAGLLIFPIPLVWKFQMGRSQKVMLTGIFALGGM